MFFKLSKLIVVTKAVLSFIFLKSTDLFLFYIKYHLRQVNSSVKLKQICEGSWGRFDFAALNPRIFLLCITVTAFIDITVPPLFIFRLDACLELLIRTGRLPEAAFLARTYLPSHVSRYTFNCRKMCFKQK